MLQCTGRQQNAVQWSCPKGMQTGSASNLEHQLLYASERIRAVQHSRPLRGGCNRPAEEAVSLWLWQKMFKDDLM